VRELEKRNLGTKATRASIVETLYERGYIKEQSIEVTSLGMKIVETLNKYSPVILDEQLTREFETDLELISGKKNNWYQDEEKTLEKAKSSIRKIAVDITSHLKSIGESLVEANNEFIEEQKKASTLTLCPICKKGNLRIMFGKKFSRYFISCNAYPECKTTFSLPPGGMIRAIKTKEADFEMCPECKDFPMMLSLRKGKRPWRFCFNPKCPTRQKKEDSPRDSNSFSGKEAS
jgi:DNA topoisomerase-1